MMDVLRCLEPEGELPARTTFPIHFIFSPLEARVYSVGVPLLQDQMTIMHYWLCLGYRFVCLFAFLMGPVFLSLSKEKESWLIVQALSCQSRSSPVYQTDPL